VEAVSSSLVGAVALVIPSTPTRSAQLNQQGFPRRDPVCRDKRTAPDQCCCIVHPGVLWPQLRHTSDIRAGSKCRTIAWPLKPQRAHTSRSTVITAAARNRDQIVIHRSRVGTPVEEMGSTSATSIRSSSSGPVRVTPLLGNAASTAKPRNPQVAAP
jgi:hypothetical protein